MTQPARYPISTLNVESTPVILTVGDQEMRGFVKFSPSGRRTYRVGSLSKSVDVPRDSVFLWRPVDAGRWPDELPEPAIIQPDIDRWKERKPVHGKPDTPVRADEWPHAGLKLGKAPDRPSSVEEAEARVLRMLRAFDVTLVDRPRYMAAWPKDWLISASIIERALRSSPSHRLATLAAGDYDDFWVDPLDVRPMPARWQPTRRDMSDLDFCFAWLTDVSDLDKKLFRWRSALPVFSFVQIAEYLDATEDRAREIYAGACQRLFAVT